MDDSKKQNVQAETRPVPGPGEPGYDPQEYYRMLTQPDVEPPPSGVAFEEVDPGEESDIPSTDSAVLYFIFRHTFIRSKAAAVIVVLMLLALVFGASFWLFRTADKREMVDPKYVFDPQKAVPDAALINSNH